MRLIDADRISKPIFTSFCEKRSDAMEYAKMYSGLPHRVNEIEKEKERMK